MLRTFFILGLTAALLIAATPLAAADDTPVRQTYDRGVASALNVANCGWEAMRSQFTGSGQSDSPVDLGERIYNQSVRDPLAVQLYSAPTPVIEPLDNAWGPGSDRVIRFADETYTYAKCSVAFYGGWATYTYVWSTETVDCYWVHSDCGVANVECMAGDALDVTFGIFGFLLGQPLPGITCTPVIGGPCLCLPPADPHAPPTVPAPEEITG